MAGGGGGAFAAEEFDLDERHGVDVGVAQADGVLEDAVGLERPGATGSTTSRPSAGRIRWTSTHSAWARSVGHIWS